MSQPGPRGAALEKTNAAGQSERTAEDWPANSIPPDDTPTRFELRSEVRRLVQFAAHAVNGLPAPRVEAYATARGGVVLDPDRRARLLTPGSAEWWDAPDDQKTAALLVLAEAWLVIDPERQARERLRQVSQAISGGMDWAAAAHSLVYEPHRVLAERRGELGPLARTIDPAAMTRWVETGSSSDGGEVPAA